MEEKSEEFQNGEMGSKFEAFKTKIESQSEELLKKTKEAGLRTGDKIDKSLDSLKRKMNQSKNNPGEGK